MGAVTPSAGIATWRGLDAATTGGDSVVAERAAGVVVEVPERAAGVVVEVVGDPLIFDPKNVSVAAVITITAATALRLLQGENCLAFACLVIATSR